MCSRSARSFPLVTLVALILGLFSLTALFAQEKKKDEATDQGRKSAPAADHRAPQPQAVPQVPAGGQSRGDERGRPNSTPAPPQTLPFPQAPAPAYGGHQSWPQQPAPAWGRDQGQGRTEWGTPSGRERSQPREQQTTPDSRYRAQPREQQTAPDSRYRVQPREQQTAPDSRYRVQPREQQTAPDSRYRVQPREQQSPSDGWSSRGDQANPYTRYRTQPRARGTDDQNGRPSVAPPTGRVERLPGNGGRSQGERATRPAPKGQDEEQPRGPAGPQLRRRTPQPAETQSPRPRAGGSAGEQGRVSVPERTRPALPNRPQAPGQVGGRPQPQGQKGQLRVRVPEAQFRGPEAEKRVRTVPERGQTELNSRLRGQLRQWNRTAPSFTQGHIQRDVVGNTIPRDARYVDRRHVTRINLSYTRVEHTLGPATNYYSFIPRYPGDYWDGYWDGYQDGYYDGRRHRPHPAVVINFYYGYYWSDPTWFGFYYPGYYASVYHYYGYCPGWVYPTRVYVYPTDYVYVPSDPYRYYSRPRVDEGGAERAIGDVRRAWLDNDIDRLARHLTDELDVQVYFDGKYEYTTSTEDYYGMTADALATTQTDSLEFDDPIFISSREVFYTGRHVFYDPDGYRQVVYVSYRMRQLGGEWYLVAVGSSLEPIQHQYSDFRYN